MTSDPAEGVNPDLDLYKAAWNRYEAELAAGNYEAAHTAIVVAIRTCPVPQAFPHLTKLRRQVDRLRPTTGLAELWRRMVRYHERIPA